MLNKQPQDQVNYVSAVTMLSNITTNSINVDFFKGAFISLKITGTSTNLVGNLHLEGAAESIDGTDASKIWCVLQTEAVGAAKFTSTTSALAAFDVTATSAKYLRLRWVFTSGTGTAALSSDVYKKPL